MREVVVRVRCDNCGAPDEVTNDEGQVIGQNEIDTDLVIAINKKSIMLDLCTICQTKLTDVLSTFWANGRSVPKDVQQSNGAKPRRPYKRRTPRVIPEHTTTEDSTPTDGSADPLTCYHCDPPRPFNRPQGVGAHKWSVHGIAGSADRTLAGKKSAQQ